MRKTATMAVLLIGLFGCGAGLPADMIVVEGGSFMMGGAFEGAEADERPLHEVEVSSFLIGLHEVTVQQFADFVEATGYVTTAEAEGGCEVLDGSQWGLRGDASWRNPYFEQDGRHPVVCVSWYDAVAYCNWRSKNEGLRPCFSGSGDAVRCDFAATGYRLPTEAEWEFAARGRGRDVHHAWGNGEPMVAGRPAANIRDETATKTWKREHSWIGYDDGFLYTAPAASFAANAIGVFDLGGNVYEWCWDWYDPEYYQTSPRANPRGPATGTMRACRDSGYRCWVEKNSVRNRGRGEPAYRFPHGGFRVARSTGG